MDSKIYKRLKVGDLLENTAGSLYVITSIDNDVVEMYFCCDMESVTYGLKTIEDLIKKKLNKNHGQ